MTTPFLNSSVFRNRQRNSLKKVLIAIPLMTLACGCHKSGSQDNALRNFKQVNLVANTAEYHPLTIDSSLLNGFGMAWSPNGIPWVNSVGGHVSELYSADGAIVAPGKFIPSPGTKDGGLPCGIVFSGGKGFKLGQETYTFLFSGFDGVLSGWNRQLSDHARRIKNPPGASYTGLAIASSQGRNLIYAANFGSRLIDVWDTAFVHVDLPFTDPTLPAGYSPYNIQAIGDRLFVMYAELGTDGHPVTGAGKGYVSIFATDGTFINRFASGRSLNVPWGATMAPAGFLEDQDINYGEPYLLVHTSGRNTHGDHTSYDSNDQAILIGNFGDGRINVFAQDGTYRGQLKSDTQPVAIEGLWALSFPPKSDTAVNSKRLYFTAGPDNEQDGLFGYLIKD